MTLRSLLAGLCFTLAACADPCTQLAEAICDCKPNQPEKNVCLEQVRIARAAKTEGVLEEEALACEALIDGCTCAELERGNLTACGLAP